MANVETIAKVGSQAAGVVGDVANMLGIGQKRQMRQTTQLMGIQQQNQMALNSQAAQLAHKQWEDTNYPAQLKMMQAAGLNPGLMYGQGGGGGTTASTGSGGSAASGQAPQARMMDLSNTLAAQQMAASVELMKAQANKTQKEADVIGTTGIPTATAGINKMIAETDNEKLKGDLIKVQTALTGIQAAKTEEQIDAQVQNLAAQARSTNLQTALTADQYSSLVKQAAQTVVQQQMEIELTKSKKQLTDAEKQGVITGIVQKWTELSQGATKLDQAQQQIEIQKFQNNIKAEYPGAWDVAGMVLKKAYKNLEMLVGGQGKADTIK